MLASIIKTATFKQSQITIIGTFINGFLGALFYILVARFLGPSDFGLLSVSIAILTLIADTVDFGTNTGLVKFVSSNLKTDYDKALKFLKLSLEIKIISWILVLGIGYLSAPFIAERIFGKESLTTPLQLVMVGVGGALLFSFATSSLQAAQKYFHWAIINISTNFLRLFFILLLVFYNQLNLISGMLSYIILPFFGFFLALLILPTGKFIKTKNEFSVAKTLFNYNIWVALFTIVAAISSRLDTFLNARLLTSFEVGIYSAANQLVSVIPQLVGALGVVAAPKFASFQTKEQMITYFKKFQLMVLALVVLGLVVAPLSYFVIPLLFGAEYTLAIEPFLILLLSMLVFLISVPLHNSIIFYFGRPDIFLWVAIGHLFIIAIFGYFMITNFGIIGSALTVLAGMVFNLIAPLIFFLIKIRK